MEIPPSPKAALVALGLFFGISVDGEPDVAADEALIADQYVSAGKTQARGREGGRLAQRLLCQVPAAKRAHPTSADVTHLRPAQDLDGK